MGHTYLSGQTQPAKINIFTLQWHNILIFPNKSYTILNHHQLSPLHQTRSNANVHTRKYWTLNLQKQVYRYQVSSLTDCARCYRPMVQIGVLHPLSSILPVNKVWQHLPHNFTQIGGLAPGQLLLHQHVRRGRGVKNCWLGPKMFLCILGTTEPNWFNYC